MTSGEHMAQVLGATGIYRLTGDSPVDWELAAYQAGFRVIEEAMETLKKELFALTAPEERLAEWERLFLSQTSQAGLEVRQKAVAKALGLRFGLATLASIESEVLPAAGVAGTVTEMEGKLVVTGSLQGVAEQEARRLLDRLLPAHLEWELNIV